MQVVGRVGREAPTCDVPNATVVSLFTPSSAIPLPLNLVIEALKGVAILMIVGIHARRGWFGWQGVHVFLVLSGFVLALSAVRTPHSWRLWATRRAARILPTYWLTAIGGAIVAALLPPAMMQSRLGVPHTAPDLLLRDLFLVRNLNYTTMFGPVNASLWYVALLVGLYACFPIVFAAYRRAATWRALAGITIVVVTIECVSRAVAVFWLDGIPVGAGHGFLRAFGSVAQPLDRLAPAAAFQLWAPFGVFPTRLGEFAAGVLAGVLWSRDPARGARVLLHPVTLVLSAAVWLGGSTLSRYRGGWVVSDLAIAVGLTPLLLHLLARIQPVASPVIQGLAWLGGWSYYVFLTHVLVATTAGAAAVAVGAGPPVTIAIAIGVAVAGLVLSCRALRSVDALVQQRVH